MAYTGQGTPKPGKIGTITDPLVNKNIGIDNKILMLIDDRVAMAGKMDLKLGEKVEYKQLTQGIDKGKINFIKRADEAPAAPAQPAAPPAEKHVPKEPRNVPGKYIGRTSNTITLKEGDENHVYTADLDLLIYLSKPDTKVHVGDNVTVQMIDNNGTWVAKNVGPGAGDDQFKTAKEILQENLDAKKAEKEQADAALAQINKENAEGEARLKEQEEFAKQLAAKNAAMKAPQTAPETSKEVSPKEPEKCQQKEDVTLSGTVKVPASFVKSENPPILNPVREEYVDPGEPESAEPLQPVEVGVHIDMGGYTNFDLKLADISGDRARQRIENDSLKMIGVMRRLMTAAKKGY